MFIEWNEMKAVLNFNKHKISFDEAQTVFGDQLSETYDDPEHSIDEQRYITIGKSQVGRVLIISHQDQNDVIRIISARKPTPAERKKYEESGY